MKYHIHVPKLLEFALNVVCDDITLRGKQCLISPIPYTLYLRCIMTYADKYDRARYSTYRFYRDIRRKVNVNFRIGRIYPNVLDHFVLDDDDVDDMIIEEVAISHLVDDAAASIQRFASRCLAADKSEMMVKLMSRVIMTQSTFSNPIIDVLLFYGAKLDTNDSQFFSTACLRGMNDVIQQAIENVRFVTSDNMCLAIESGNCDTINLVLGACHENIDRIGTIYYGLDMINATVQSLELLMSLNIIQRGKHYEFSNIPSFSVLQWILDHDVMEHDDVLIDIARSASRFSGHYFDVLRYFIEQRDFTVPRDILVKLYLWLTTDLGVFDYLLLHGADLNSHHVSVVDRYGKNVLERSPLLIRYWIDKGFVIKSNETNTLIYCIASGMTASVLEMMIEKYELNVNAADQNGNTALHEACDQNKYELVEMLLRHGADVNKCDRHKITPYERTSDDHIKQLLISFGCEPSQ